MEISGKITRLDPIIGAGKGNILISNGGKRYLTYKGSMIFEVYDQEKLILKSSLIKGSLLNKILRNQLVYHDGDGRVVLVNKNGAFYIDDVLQKPKVKNIGNRLTFEESSYRLDVNTIEDSCRFECSVDMMHSVIAMALAAIFELHFAG